MGFKVGEYCEIKGQVIDIVNPLGVALKHAVYFPYTSSSKWYDPQVIWIPWTQDSNSGLDVRIGDLVDVKGFVVEVSRRFDDETGEIEKNVLIRIDVGNGRNKHINVSEEDYVNFLEGLNDRDRT